MAEDYPGWVPVAVRSTAQALLALAPGDYEDAPQAAALIRRLATDPEMQKVWSLLQQKTRRPPLGYLHPVRITEPKPGALLDSPEYADPAAVTQEFAMVMLFQFAVHYFCAGRIVTKSEVVEWRHCCLDVAARLRNDADQLRELGFGTERQLEVLAALAVQCETSAGAPVLATVLDRAHGDVRLRAYLARLSRETKRLFGKPLYRTVATIASVAFGKEVTVKMVREAAPT